MKINLILSFSLILILSNCSQPVKEEIKYDFRKANWGATIDNILNQEAPLQAKTYEENSTVEIEYEDTFLGVKTNLDSAEVAKCCYFFDNNSLKAAWYYIFTKKEKFDATPFVQDIKTKYGEPAKTWTENGNENIQLWITENTAIKILTRDAEDKFRFEWYNYELEWFNNNKQDLNIPE